ncbi:MAG: alpha/beta hydrolase [Opitutales bacterium]|nr:alpha/beta hydrolase [Opitutales bacterium]
MKKSIAILAALIAGISAFAANINKEIENRPDLSDYDTAPFIDIWQNGKMPGAVSAKGDEVFKGEFGKNNQRKGFVIENVSKPQIQFYDVKGAKNAPAILVCPGGAYLGLQYSNEGLRVARFLNSIGVKAFVLKYRVPYKMNERDPVNMDAQRAVKFIRHNASKFGVDPKKIGMMGFSAGGNLTAWMSCNFDKKLYEPTDKIDSESARPDIACLVYPHLLNNGREPHYTPSAEMIVREDTPPSFIVHAQDDGVPLASSLSYVIQLYEKKVPMDVHFFSKGGHGFSVINARDIPADIWTDAFIKWLEYMKFKPKPAK